VNHTLYAPLAVGYGITALGGVTFLGIFVASICAQMRHPE